MDLKPPEQVPPELRPFMPGTFDHEAFERFRVPVAECGQFWSDMIIPALDVLARLPAGRVLQVSYEDLVAEPRQVLLRLARFAGLPDTHPGWLDRAVQLAQPRSPRWLALPHDQIRELTRVCEPAMRRLVVIVPYRAPGARTKTGSEASGTQNLSPCRSNAIAERQTGTR